MTSNAWSKKVEKVFCVELFLILFEMVGGESLITDPKGVGGVGMGV